MYRVATIDSTDGLSPQLLKNIQCYSYCKRGGIAQGISSTATNL